MYVWSVRFVWIPESLALDIELFLRASNGGDLADAMMAHSGARDLREYIRTEIGARDIQTEADWDLGVERMLAMLREDAARKVQELGRDLTLAEVMAVLGMNND